jgi:hypothetical protein
MSPRHPKGRVFELVGIEGGLLMVNATAVTGENFDTEVLQSKEPVLVDSGLSGADRPHRLCGGGNRRRLRELKVEAGRGRERGGLGALRRPDHPDTLLFKDGKPVERLIGAYPKPMILSKIQRHLEPS